MIESHMPTPKKRGIKAWPTDIDAVIAAVEGCQQGMGGIFPNGTAGMYVHYDDQVGYAERRAQLNRIAEGLRNGTILLAEIRESK